MRRHLPCGGSDPIHQLTHLNCSEKEATCVTFHDMKRGQIDTDKTRLNRKSQKFEMFSHGSF